MSQTNWYCIYISYDNYFTSSTIILKLRPCTDYFTHKVMDCLMKVCKSWQSCLIFSRVFLWQKLKINILNLSVCMYKFCDYFFCKVSINQWFIFSISYSIWFILNILYSIWHIQYGTYSMPYWCWTTLVFLNVYLNICQCILYKSSEISINLINANIHSETQNALIANIY